LSYATGIVADVYECATPLYPWYIGTLNVTENGRVCQRWDSQSPQSHEFGTIDMLPDNTMAEAGNHCRWLEATPRPWCYTVDDGYRWEYCTVPTCN
jgi:apolipoprotein a